MIYSPIKMHYLIILSSNFRLLKAFYIDELILIEKGIPLDVIHIANGLNSTIREIAFFNSVSDKKFSKIKCLIFNRVFGDNDIPRQNLLKMADQAKADSRFRYACQIYGWIMLTSEIADNEFQWSVNHLKNIGSEHYNIKI